MCTIWPVTVPCESIRQTEQMFNLLMILIGVLLFCLGSNMHCSMIFTNYWIVNLCQGKNEITEVLNKVKDMNIDEQVKTVLTSRQLKFHPNSVQENATHTYFETEM